VNYINLTLGHRRGEGGTHRREGRRRRRARLGLGEGRGSGRGRCREMRGLGRPFNRRPGRGGWRSSGTGEARRGGDNGGTVVAMGRLGAGSGEWSPGHSVRGRMAPNLTGERVMARRRGGRWSAMITSMADHGGGTRNR
jgi:hypothetical protein